MAFAQLFRVAAVMAGFGRPWGFCGGWALDLFLNQETRGHVDVDVAVLRRDQVALRRHLVEREWWLEIADGSKLTPWEDGRIIQPPLHGIWASNQLHDPTFIEFLLSEGNETTFQFAGDPSITLPLDEAFVRSEAGLPVLAPQIVLLHQVGDAATPPPPTAALAALGEAQRKWLRRGIERLYPGHVWLEQELNSVSQ